MSDLKTKVIIGGLLSNAIICIILVLILDCLKYGVYIAAGDIIASILWLFVGSAIVDDYERNKIKNN
jgi:hypothetical protein